jgi:cell division protein ZapA (FtsZ GTPase activity inhibitor)
MRVTLRILGQDVALDCASGDERRLQDLASALEARLRGFSGNADAMRGLLLTSLALLDEAQATGAALARARLEIERLTDMLVEAKLAAPSHASPEDERGRVEALRVAQGAA